MQIHYGEYEYFIRFNAIENTIRKTVNEITANLTFQGRPGKRIRDYIPNTGIYFDGEIIAKSLFTIMVIINPGESLIKIDFPYRKAVILCYSNFSFHHHGLRFLLWFW